MITIGWKSYTIEVNLWNPVYAVAPFVLLSVSIPLAIFAWLTTSIACFLLFCRAFVVYVELTVALVGAWLDPNPLKKGPSLHISPASSSPIQLSPNRHRQLHSSIGSAVSSQETIAPSGRPARLDISSGISMTSLNTSELPRDYEGVGGWRTPGNDDEEALWMGMNSGLQLPGDTPIRRHQRSLSGGHSPLQLRSWSPEASRTSLLHGQIKTPVRFALENEGDYFPPQPTTTARRMNNATEFSKNHKRRKSGSSSSSSGLMMAEKSTVD